MLLLHVDRLMKKRDGFLVGEGAGVMILESRRNAAARRANVIAKVVAGGWLSDPTGMTQIDSKSGVVVSEVLKRTLTSKHRCPDILSVHGTGTESNDFAEARGIRTAFAASPTMPACFGVKGAMGHLLGAAGSVETIVTLLALQHQKIPGTANLSNIDAHCRIPLNSQVQTLPQIQQAAKLSLGFEAMLRVEFLNCLQRVQNLSDAAEDDELGISWNNTSFRTVTPVAVLVAVSVSVNAVFD